MLRKSFFRFGDATPTDGDCQGHYFTGAKSIFLPYNGGEFSHSLQARALLFEALRKKAVERLKSSTFSVVNSKLKKRRKLTPETCARISETVKRRWAEKQEAGRRA